MDYPAYGLRTRRAEIANRIAYSLFDKVALFLNAYIDLQIAPNRVSSRKLWYNQSDGKRDDWQSHFQIGPTGRSVVFLASKDLVEEDVFGEVLEPDAQGLHGIRNYST